MKFCSFCQNFFLNWIFFLFQDYFLSSPPQTQSVLPSVLYIVKILMNKWCIDMQMYYIMHLSAICAIQRTVNLTQDKTLENPNPMQKVPFICSLVCMMAAHCIILWGPGDVQSSRAQYIIMNPPHHLILWCNTLHQANTETNCSHPCDMWPLLDQDLSFPSFAMFNTLGIQLPSLRIYFINFCVLQNVYVTFAELAAACVLPTRSLLLSVISRSSA